MNRVRLACKVNESNAYSTKENTDMVFFISDKKRKGFSMFTHSPNVFHQLLVLNTR